jgi:hypothetical protein
LWEATGLAAPTRLEFEGIRGALSAKERQSLYQQLTDWYYRDGNGMLLESETRRLYLDAKHNLCCSPSDLRPTNLLRLLPGMLDKEQQRGLIAIRQLSLMRTQMKKDLAIYGRPYVGSLTAHEKAFLRHCKINLRAQPWRRASLGPERDETFMP